LKSNAALILEREDTQKLIDIIKEKNATLINELLPDLASVGLIQRVLQNLLGEGVPIKNLTLILETIADFAPYTKNPDDLSEQARRRLALYFVTEYESDPGVIRAMTIDPRLESTMVSRVKRNQFEVGLMMDPQTTQHLLKGLEPRFTQMTGEGLTPVIMTTTELRLPLKRFLEPNFPRLVVLAYQEVPAQVTVQNHGILSAPLPNNEANEGANQAAPAA
jgi:flagellar biosynthesis protein FlhA